MSYRNKCIAVVALGVASLLLGSWFLGEHTPNALVLLVGVPPGAYQRQEPSS